jgi:hypothetical protein
MRHCNYLSVLAISLVLITVTGCGSAKKAATGVKGDVEINMPCSGYDSDNDYFRAMMPAVSNNMAAAKTQALILARAELAGQINTLVKRVNETYVNSFTSGEKNETRIKMDDLIRTVITERISGSRLICEKMMQTPDSQYRYYAAVELSKAEILKSIESRLKQEEQLRTAFEYEKFKEIFEKEMGKE